MIDVIAMLGGIDGRVNTDADALVLDVIAGKDVGVRTLLFLDRVVHETEVLRTEFFQCLDDHLERDATVLTKCVIADEVADRIIHFNVDELVFLVADVLDSRYTIHHIFFRHEGANATRYLIDDGDVCLAVLPMHIEVDTTAERENVVTCVAHFIHECDLYRIEFLLCVDRQFLAVTTNDIEVIERLEDVFPSRICTTDCGLHVIDDGALRVIHREAELVFRERAVFFLELRDIRVLSLVSFDTHLEYAHEEIDEPVLAFFVVFVQEESFDDDTELIRDDTDAVIVDLDHAGHLLTECRRSIVGRLVIHRACRIDIDRTRDEPGIPDYFYEAVILAREMDNAFIAIFI